MAKLFNNKYRIDSARLQSWDYGRAGAYFITICTHHRMHFFGEIKNGRMCLNKIGTLAHHEWLKTIDLRPDMNLELGQFVVMPNHFHAIIIIKKNKYNTQKPTTRFYRPNGRDALQCVSTDPNSQPTTPAKPHPTPPQNQFGPQRKNISSIIRGYKSTITKQARKIEPTFKWQTRFHDHIIKNDQAFQNISNYIVNNPVNWKEDRFSKPAK